MKDLKMIGDMEASFVKQLESWRNCRLGLPQKVFLAVSGGPDSTLLAHLMVKYRQQLGMEVVLCYFYHGWWSSFDQVEVDFCRQLADDLGLEIVVGQPRDFPEVIFNGSYEEKARRERRLFFKSLLDDTPGSVVALGHNHDDQIETFFIRIARGCGLRGLIGMHFFQDQFLRPLINFSKSDILAACKAGLYRYLEDPDNQSEKRLRNRIRAKLIPVLDSVDIRFKNQIDRVMANLHKEQMASEFLFNLCSKSMGLDKDWIEIDSFMSLPEAIRWRYFTACLSFIGVEIDPAESLCLEFERFLKTREGGSHDMNQFLVIKKGRFFKIEINVV